MKTKEEQFVHAAENGDLAEVKRLIADGVDVNTATGDCRWTALMSAARMGHSDVARTLLSEKNIKVDMKDIEGYTALIWAAGERYFEVAEMLLDKDADIEAKDNGGTTALMLAATCGRVKVLILLLKRGANIDAEDNDGNTVYDVASRM